MVGSDNSKEYNLQTATLNKYTHVDTRLYIPCNKTKSGNLSIDVALKGIVIPRENQPNIFSRIR